MDESELEKEEEVRLEKLVPIVLIAANIFGCIISLALLKLLFMTRLHVNCKFLLKTWTTCFLVQFVLNIVIFALNFSMDELPKNKQDPPIRHTLYSLELTAQQISTIYELGVATERIISSIRPEEYYRSRLAWKLLYPITVTICGCSLWSQVLFTNEGYHSLFVAVVLSLDIFTICANMFAKRYCTRRFQELYGNGTLNARYQVRESYQTATAMKPVYISTLIIKFVLFAPILIFCYETNEEYDCVSRWIHVPYAYVEQGYFAMLTASSIFLIACFIRTHPRLRRKAEVFWQRLRGIPVTVTSQSEGFALQKREDEADVYFEKLKRSWDEGMRRKK